MACCAAGCELRAALCCLDEIGFRLRHRGVVDRSESLVGFGEREIEGRHAHLIDRHAIKVCISQYYAASASAAHV